MKKTNLEFIGKLLLVVYLVTFIPLKLMGFIDTSWWYITFPFWGSLLLSIALVILTVIIILIKKVKPKLKK